MMFSLTPKKVQKRVSISGLGVLNISPTAYKVRVLDRQQEEERKSYFIIGDAFDCYITTPNEFFKRFAVAKGQVPSESMRVFIETYVELEAECKNTGVTFTDEIKETARIVSGYKWLLPRVLDEFKKILPQQYYMFVKANLGKVPISQVDFNVIKCMRDQLYQDKYTSNYISYIGHKDELIECVSQWTILWDYYGIPAKSILDIVLINHAKKTIQPIDLKTTGKPVYDFNYSYITYGYYRQAAFYNQAIRWYIRNEDKNLRHYRILPFKFIVVEKECFNPPIIFESSLNDLYVGEYGGYLDEGKRKVVGFRELIEELEWQKEQEEWMYTKDYVQEGGVLRLDSFIKNE